MLCNFNTYIMGCFVLVFRLMSSEEHVKNLLREADPLNTVNVLIKSMKMFVLQVISRIDLTYRNIIMLSGTA